MKKRLTCFWCNRAYKDLIRHTKNIHPNLSPRSHDYVPDRTRVKILVINKYEI